MNFLSYYFAFGARKPLFIGGRGALRNIANIVSSETGLYCPTVWSFGGHLHTIFGKVLKSRLKVNYTSEHIEIPDGGRLRLDWASASNESTKDIVLILPGLTGTSDDNYILHLVVTARDLGFRVVVMNHRGSVTPPMTYQACCAANSDDLEFVLQHIHESLPTSRVCAVGISLGGLVLTNYLVRMGSSNRNSFLLAAFVISVPWDPFVSSNSLEKPLSHLLFNCYLTRRLRKFFTVHVTSLRQHGIDVPEGVEVAAAKVTTIREFDDAVTSQMFGYRDVDDYYMAVHNTNKSLEFIKTPLLCLNAADDPFSPYEQIPVEKMKNCENVSLILTHTGGHVGFLEGVWPTGHGYLGRVYREYIQAVFEEL